MESAGDDVEVAGDAAVAQPARVLDVFVVEEVEGADADPGRRKTGEILAAGCGRVRGDVRARDGVAEVGRPAVSVALGRPDAHLEGVQVGSRRRAVVQHGVEEQLERWADLGPVMGEQREGRGDSAARAGTADRDAVDVDVQVARALGQSAQRGVGVLDRGGRGMVRPQSVTDRGDGDAELAGEGDVRAVVLLGCAEDQSASVYPEQRRSRCLQARPAGRREARRAVRSWARARRSPGP